MVQNTEGTEPSDASEAENSGTKSRDREDSHSENASRGSGGWRVASPESSRLGASSDRSIPSVSSNAAASVAAAIDSVKSNMHEGGEGWQDDSAPALDEFVKKEKIGSRTSDAALVVLGILAGVYILYTVGWVSIARDYALYYSLVVTSSGAVGDVMYQILIWLTAATPAIWGAAVIVLTKGSSVWKRITWLALGAIFLIPLPSLFQQVIY
ncbi:hypothetical protein [Lysinibacter sp. HNR]|uniref:hypothetical protein n=1 Tax=Lysinibacter sp. HNR TaxID=3031408 RepID=UPI0024353A71|nr:hypothetical protein [Lysinibacter sp. HNR]WGD38252.1 hypothetical protein FrondiHNR_04875 [Lysinibacter sp. HNR]